MVRLNLLELDLFIQEDPIEGSFSALVDLKPNRTWVVTFEHALALPGVQQVASGRVVPVIRPKRAEAEN